jgi:hypothetical protein
MPTPAPDRSRRKLTNGQRLWLLYGFDEKWGNAFTNKEEYVDAYWRNRDSILQECPRCRRPIAWWYCEARLKFPGHALERRALYELDLLPTAERLELLEEWRADFERNDWNDGPPSLLAEWEAERASKTPAA